MPPRHVILNVNDDEATRYSTTRILKNAGWDVIEADTGDRALAQVSEQHPSLVVLDVKLPDVSGFEVCRRIKTNPATASIPVLHLSAHRISSHDKAYGLDSGADAYLAQPAEPVELAAMVRALLRANEARLAAERAALITAQTQRVTAALAEAVTPLEVSEATLKQGVAAVGAFAGVVLCLGDRHLELVGAYGYRAAALEGWQHVPLAEHLPVTDAVRDREPVWLRSSGEIHGRYPMLRDAVVEGEALVAVPLVVRNEVQGVLGLSFKEAQDFDDEKRAFIVTLGRLCGQALQRARLFQRENEARSEAEEAVRVRDEFLAIASHELKNPLSALQLQVQTALRRGARGGQPVDDGKFLERLQMMDRSVGRLSRLIDDLLDVSRISAGKLELQPEPVDIYDVVEEVATRAHDELLKTRSVLTVKGDRGVVGKWDRSRLDQVATNLISNAIKYGQGKPIEVLVFRSGDRVTLRVRDRGVGIAPEDAARIFNRFERASANRHIRGLGLGLWIVRAIVEAMGGTISVESKVGEGSTFSVELPLESATATPSASTSEPAALP